jgi:hypothetical protein
MNRFYLHFGFPYQLFVIMALYAIRGISLKSKQQLVRLPPYILDLIAENPKVRITAIIKKPKAIELPLNIKQIEQDLVLKMHVSNGKEISSETL